MALIQNGQKERLLSTLQEIWKNQPLVKEFELTYDASQIEPAAGGWAVPVASGVPDANAYSLNRALSKIQEETEGMSNLEVSIILDADLD